MMDRKERTVVITLLINLLLIAFKFWLAALSGSLALRSSAVHSAADLTIGVFVLIGLFISRRERPLGGVRHGLGLVENWVALAVSAAIFYVGLDIVLEVLQAEAPELRNLGPITLAALVTVAVAYIVARYKSYVGRQTDSPALIASAYHSQIDIYASIVVVTGLAGAALGLANLDRAAAAVVAVLIFLSGYQIAASAASALRHRRLLDLEGETGQRPPPPPHRWWRVYGPIASGLLLALYLASGFYTVQPGEEGLVRTFGAVIAQQGPGLHYRWPAPIERVDVIATDRIRRVETDSSQLLTGDESLISARASLHYGVTDSKAFLLNVADSASLVKQVGRAALRAVVARERVDALLTVDKRLIEQRAAASAQAALDENEAGIKILDVQLLQSDPPAEVAEAFRDVASAREDRNTFMNEAHAYRNEILPVARGEAERIRQAAIAYRAQKTAAAAAEAARFVAQQGAYAQSRDITRRRLYLEAIERVLPGARKFVLDPAISLETTDLWIPGTLKTKSLPMQP